MSLKVQNERWGRWSTCSLCEQGYHGVVSCALGWACWKTYVGRPETDWARKGAMTQLGNGLHDAEYHEDALSVREAGLSMMRRIGASEQNILAAQSKANQALIARNARTILRSRKIQCALACALVALLVALVAIVFKR